MLGSLRFRTKQTKHSLARSWTTQSCESGRSAHSWVVLKSGLTAIRSSVDTAQAKSNYNTAMRVLRTMLEKYRLSDATVLILCGEPGNAISDLETGTIVEHSTCLYFPKGALSSGFKRWECASMVQANRSSESPIAGTMCSTT